DVRQSGWARAHRIRVPRSTQPSRPAADWYCEYDRTAVDYGGRPCLTELCLSEDRDDIAVPTGPAGKERRGRCWSSPTGYWLCSAGFVTGPAVDCGVIVGRTDFSHPCDSGRRQQGSTAVVLPYKSTGIRPCRTRPRLSLTV